MTWFRHKHKWVVMRTIWPYPEGYGTCCKGCRTVLDTGLSRKQAIKSVEELNNVKP